MLREMLKLANYDAVVCHLLFIVECSNESLSRAYITLSDNLKCSYNPLEYLLSMHAKNVIMHLNTYRIYCLQKYKCVHYH